MKKPCGQYTKKSIHSPQARHEVACLLEQNAESLGHSEVLLEDSECHPASQEPGSQLLEEDQNTTYKSAHCIFSYSALIRTLQWFHLYISFHCMLTA
jgi:hypothetical protein